MSLRPDDRSSRHRDRSKTRDRSRSRSNVRVPEVVQAPSPPSATAYGYSAPPPGSFDEVTSPTYEVRSPVSAEPERSEYFRQPPARTSTYPLPSSSAPYPQDDHYDSTRNDYKDYGRSDYPSRMPAMPDDDFADLAYGDVSSPNGSRQHSYSSAYPPHDPYATQMPAYPRRPEPPASGSRTSSYSHDRGYGSREESYSSKSQYESRGLRSDESLSKYESRDTKPQYDSRDVKPQYDSRDSKSPYDSRDVKPQYESRMPQSEDRSHDPRHDSARRAFSYDSYGRDANVVEMVPKGDKDSKSKSSRLSIDNRSGAPDASRSLGVSTRMERLSVSGNRPDLSGAGDLPPPSPLLEAYHGTYQQLSPMPSAMRSFEDDDELDMLEPLSPSTTRGGSDKLAQDAEKKKKKSVKVDNYEEDAERILKALQKSRVDTATLCEIIPALTHDQIIHVRREYKKQVKVQGKGVNLAKHIKTKLSGNLGKAAYVTALGRWESEGYWANFFYQSHGSRRELLIESLMGRTNREILEIKEEFRDKKYSDDLVKCMERELKMDKFRVAVLMALEGRRQEEQDIYPQEYRNRDVQTLHKALTAKQGGESVMLEIIVRRSDAHLREVMKTYDRMFQDNFPRAALKKSSNLVGEVIAHILNGVINKPVRDALLLRHAIKDIAEKNKDEELRYELLISRIVRLHWDRPHLMKVKREYYDKYKKHLEEDIQDATSGEFTDFMWNLCDVQKKAP